MPKKPGRVARGAAAGGIVGAIISSLTGSGGSLPQRSYTSAHENYSQSRTTQRDQQTQHVRGGTRDQGMRRRGSSQR